MKENYLTGRMLFANFYVFESIAAIVIAFALKNIPTTHSIAISLYLIISCVLFAVARRKRLYSELVEAYIGSFVFSFMSYILGYVFDNTQVFVYAVFVHCVVMATYIDKKIYSFNVKITMISLIVSFTYAAVMFPGKFNISLYVIGAIGVMGVQWVCYSIIKTISAQNRRSREQERSLDDMLEVVEAKCEEARRATRTKSEFLSNMSHEIRTPINAVLGMNEMILRESNDSNIIEYATNVASSGKMLLSIINDILDFSKIESGRMEIIPVEYQVSAVINDLINMIRPRLDEKDLKFDIEVNEKLPNYLYGDEVRIRQIVTNLLTNAVKYTDYGSVTLAVRFEEKEENEINLIIDVRDTGRGIKGADINHLFDAFMRMDEKMNRNIEGTGLGLSITKNFVDMMGGVLSVDSVYGGGSTFTVTIPQRVIKDEPIGDFKKQYQTGVKNKSHYHESFVAPDARILVVDDNEMNLKVVIGLLKQTHVQVATATGGKQCLEMLREGSYDILFLDHMMPGMDGLATLRRIKAERLDKDMPVIALTANAVSGAREMYKDYGFADYLSKPISGRELEKLLYMLLPEDKVLTTEQADLSKEIIYSGLIDSALGMKYCMNDKALYKEVLGIFKEQADKQMTMLSQMFQEKDWDNYAILVHSIKTNALNIGAGELADMAKEQEMTARAGMEDALSEGFQDFLDKYSAVVKEIDTIIT